MRYWKMRRAKKRCGFRRRRLGRKHKERKIKEMKKKRENIKRKKRRRIKSKRRNKRRVVKKIVNRKGTILHFFSIIIKFLLHPSQPSLM